MTGYSGQVGNKLESILDLPGYFQLIALAVDKDRISIVYRTTINFTARWSRSRRSITRLSGRAPYTRSKSFFREEVLRRTSNLKRDMSIVKALSHFAQLYLNYAPQLITAQLFEDNSFVYPVEKLRTELLTQSIVHPAAHLFVLVGSSSVMYCDPMFEVIMMIVFLKVDRPDLANRSACHRPGFAGRH